MVQFLVGVAFPHWESQSSQDSYDISNPSLLLILQAVSLEGVASVDYLHPTLSILRIFTHHSNAI